MCEGGVYLGICLNIDDFFEHLIQTETHINLERLEEQYSCKHYKDFEHLINDYKYCPHCGVKLEEYKKYTEIYTLKPEVEYLKYKKLKYYNKVEIEQNIVDNLAIDENVKVCGYDCIAVRKRGEIDRVIIVLECVDLFDGDPIIELEIDARTDNTKSIFEKTMQKLGIEEELSVIVYNPLQEF